MFIKSLYIYIYIYIYKVKLATIVEGNQKAPFSIATTPMCRGRRYSFPGLLYFTLDPYLIMLSAKQGGIKYHFLSLWYDSTWDWTQVSRAIGEHSKPLANVRYCLVSWGCRVHRLLLSWGVRSTPQNECPGCNTKQSDGQVPVMLEIGVLRSTPSLPLFPSSLWPVMIEPDRVPSMGQIERNCVLMRN